MTLWFQIPAMLKAQPDEELERMKGVCRAHRVKYARGPEKELADATRMLKEITAEQRRRAANSIIVGRSIQ